MANPQKSVYDLRKNPRRSTRALEQLEEEERTETASSIDPMEDWMEMEIPPGRLEDSPTQHTGAEVMEKGEEFGGTVRTEEEPSGSRGRGVPQANPNQDLMMILIQEMRKQTEKMEELKEDIKTDQARQTQEIRELKTEQATQMKELHKQLEKQDVRTEKLINEIRSEMKRQAIVCHEKTNLLENKMKIIEAEMEDVRQETSEKIENVRQETSEKIIEEVNQCQSRMNQRISENSKEWIKYLSEQKEENQREISTIQQNITEIKNQKATATPNIYLTCNSNKATDILPKFNGRNKNPMGFLKRLRAYIINNQRKEKLSEMEYEETISSCMEDYAEKWWNLVKEEIQNFDEFEQLFVSKYWNKDIQKGIKRRLELEKYRNDGKLSRAEYFIERVVTLKQMTPILMDEEILSILIEHFENRIQDSYRVQNITTIKEFEKLLTREDTEERNAKIKNLQMKPNLTNFRSSQPTKNEPFQYPRPQHEFKYRPQNQPKYDTRYSPPQNHNTRFNYNNNKSWNQNYTPRNSPNNFTNRRYTPNEYRNRPQSPNYGNRNQNDHRYPTTEQKEVCQMIAHKTQMTNEPNKDPINHSLN